MESPRRSRPRAGAAARGEEPTQEQGAWGELLPTRGGPVLEQFAPGVWMDPVVRTHIWSSSGRAAACGKPTPDQFVKDCIPWVGPHSTGDKSDREGAAEKKCCRLTITPIPPFPCAARGEEVEEGGWGGEVLLVSFLCFSLL